MRCSIVINTYERPESLSRCIGALSRQRGIDEVEVIAVDDGSRGDFKAIERNWKTKLNFRYLKIRHSGRSAARNRGVAAAKGDRIIFLGDDVIAKRGWLERHLNYGADDRLIAVLGPYPLQLKTANGRAASAAFRRFADPVNLDSVEDRRNLGFSYFATGNLSMDRELFNEIGGFDERFKRYGWEDVDLGYRFERAGGRLIYDEKAQAVHAHPAMRRAELWEREFSMGVTAFQFWSKWRNEDLDFMKFWGEGEQPGPAWRRALGRAAIEGMERIAPNSELLGKLYERLVYSYRHAGVAEGRRLFDGSGSGDAGPARESE